MRYVIAFARFWYDFIVGDDWRIAAGVAAVLVAGGVIVAAGGGSGTLPILLLIGLIVVFTIPLLASARGSAAAPSPTVVDPLDID